MKLPRIALYSFVLLTPLIVGGVWLPNNNNNNICIKNRKLIDEKFSQYTNALSKKIIVFGSFPILMDFFRSGPIVRKELLPFIPRALSRIKWPSYVKGVALFSFNADVLYRVGIRTPNVISVEFCYINETLNRESGLCSGELILYIEKQKLKQTLALNLQPASCEQSKELPFLNYYEDEYLKFQSNIYIELN